MGQVVNRDELAKLADKLRAEGKKIVATNGCFDLLHVGHVRILQASKKLGDVLIVGLNSDQSTKRLKGPERPINSENDRAEILTSLSCIDYVSIFEEDTAVEFLKAAKPHIYVKGSDYQQGTLPEAPIVESLGGRIELVQLVPGKSTTSIVEKMRTERI
jgi:rfaE bifunctional protein nucleotidyltransferase chain/domain